MIKKMSNYEIYNNAKLLLENFNEELNLPVRVGFYLQKNIKNILSMAEEIDKERINIFNKYGTYEKEEGVYTFEPDKRNIINQEINDLFSLEQEVKINMIQLNSFDNINLNTKQIQAISFMIEDKEEE